MGAVRRLLALLAGLLLGAGLPLCLATAARADAPSASWTAGPAGGRGFFYLEGAPGGTAADTLVVTNRGRDPLIVRLSGTGAAAGRLHFARPAVSAPARSRAEIPFTVTLPARGQAPAGAQSGALLANGRAIPLRLRLAADPGPPTHLDDAGTAPTVQADPASTPPGVRTTVTGSNWPTGALLTVLLCGQDAIGGTAACDNSHGLAVTTDGQGSFTLRLPVTTPPKPCPCVIHVTAVSGSQTSVDTSYTVQGAPTAPLPASAGALTPLSADLQGRSGLFNWFGAPASRTLVVIVANLGQTPVTDPVFRLGTAHSVFAPGWQSFQWNGTVPPGGKQEIDVPVTFSSGAHGPYEVQLQYQSHTMTEQSLTLPRSWGVTLFWLLLCVVVPATLFRLALAVLDHFRPRRSPPPETTPQESATSPVPPRPAHPPTVGVPEPEPAAPDPAADHGERRPPAAWRLRAARWLAGGELPPSPPPPDEPGPRPWLSAERRDTLR